MGAENQPRRQPLFRRRSLRVGSGGHFRSPDASPADDTGADPGSSETAGDITARGGLDPAKRRVD